VTQRLLSGWAVALALAGPAAAHTSLEASSPPDGAVLRAAPPAVVLRFAAAPQTVRARVSPAEAAAGPARTAARDARRVIVPLRPGAAGRYRIDWELVAADGDLVTGAVRFRVAPPPVASAVRRLGARLRAVGAAVRSAAGERPSA
jgi:copper resistance protein C